MSVVDLKNIQYLVFSKEGEVPILRNVNLQVNKGEFHLITGPSGSGKTTLLQIIATILHQTKGKRNLFNIVVESETNKELIYSIRSKIGYLFQTPFLPPHLKVKEYIEIQTALSGIDAFTSEEITSDFLKEMRIKQFESKNPTKLSGGERQRVALSGVLAKKVELLLLDEPLGSLDFENKKIIWEIIENLKQKNLTIIVVSHDESLSEFFDFCHKLDYGIMKD